MGCGSSKEARGKRPARQQGAGVAIGAPQDVQIHMPRNRADAHGVPIPQSTYEIDRLTLRSALSDVAAFLHQRRAQLTLVAVGGAVNTLFLRTRSSTHDIDVFGSNLNNSDRMLLDEGMQYAIRKSGSPLGTDWLNTENQMWLSPTLHRELTNEANQQNVVVFDSPGLKVLAAPWYYAFSGKIQRLLSGGNQVRSYDLADAVHYLDRIIRQQEGQPVSVGMIEGWAGRFHHTTSKNYLLKTVNTEYQRKFGKRGIR